MKFRKKPVVIDAIQFSGLWEDAPKVIEFTKGAAFEVSDLDFKRQYLKIKTLEGVLTISPKDWIIKGIQGEFYPCKSDIFEATYEAVESWTKTPHEISDGEKGSKRKITTARDCFDVGYAAEWRERQAILKIIEEVAVDSVCCNRSRANAIALIQDRIQQRNEERGK